MRNQQLTEKQQAFVMALVTKACTGTQAAIDAGFSEVSARQQASNLLSLKHVQEGIRAAQFQMLNANLANLAIATLSEVMLDKTAPAGARVSAAIAVLDRAEIHNKVEAARLSEQQKLVSEMNRSELEAFIRSSENFLEGNSTENAISQSN
jgi:phage terminase small subunit